MKLNKILIILIAILVLTGCKDNKLAGITVEINTPAVNQEGVLIESIGIETLGGVFTPLILTGTMQPVIISQIFSTASDNQNLIMIKIYRGNVKMIQEATFLGSYQATGISPAPRGEPKVEITFSVNDSDIRLFAKDLNTNKEIKIIKK